MFSGQAKILAVSNRIRDFECDLLDNSGSFDINFSQSSW